MEDFFDYSYKQDYPFADPHQDYIIRNWKYFFVALAGNGQNYYGNNIGLSFKFTTDKDELENFSAHSVHNWYMGFANSVLIPLIMRARLLCLAILFFSPVHLNRFLQAMMPHQLI